MFDFLSFFPFIYNADINTQPCSSLLKTFLFKKVDANLRLLLTEYLPMSTVGAKSLARAKSIARRRFAAATTQSINIF